MKRFLCLLAIGCLVSTAGQAQVTYGPGGEVLEPGCWVPAGGGSYGWGGESRSYYDWAYETGLDREISRIENTFDRSTPEASGRFGEVTARFGPEFSPYYQSQIQQLIAKRRDLPPPGTPEAHNLIVELSGRAMRRHNALMAEQLLTLYDVRAIRHLADRGVTLDMVSEDFARSRDRLAARLPADYLPRPTDSVVKVATFRDATGHLLPRDGGPKTLNTLTFTPDAPENIVLMMTLQATMQRMDDSRSTASVRLEGAIPERLAGLYKSVAGPTIHLFDDDPGPVRKQSSLHCIGEDGTWNTGLHDMPRYLLRLVTPEGARGGDIKVIYVMVKVYYITGTFVEAGTIR